jgi:hypothetical protein
MRQGLFEVQLMTEDHRPFQESLIDNKTYFHAEPGTQYYVKINVYRDPITKKFPAKYLRFGLYVDGVDVQYWKRLDLHILSNNEGFQGSSPPSSSSTPSSSSATSQQIQCVSSHFYGFKKNHEELRSFKVAVPSTSSDSQNSTDSPVGTIKVVVFEARVTEGIYDNRGGFHEIPSQHLVSEGKKFWQQASVATTGGSRISSEKEKFSPLTRWENISQNPMATITCYYHSPATILVLRNIHNSSNSTGSISVSGKRKHDQVQNQIVRDHNKVAAIESADDVGTTVAEGGDDDDAQSVDTIPDVSLIVKPKVVPFCDLTNDESSSSSGPQWTTKLVQR